MSGIPIDRAICHAIGGGWGADSPGDGLNAVRVVRGADFPEVAIGNIANTPVRYESRKRIDTRRLKANDLILEISGGTKSRPTGRTIRVTQGMLEHARLPIIPASFCRLIRINPQIAEPSFVYYALQVLYNEGGTWAYQNQSTGLSNFQFELFRKRYHLPDLDIEEQSPIAEVLGALDDKIAANQEQALIASDLADALYQHARQQAHQHVPLAGQVTTQYGLTTSAVVDGLGPRFLRVTDINKKPWIAWESVPGCEIDTADLAKYRAADGDILVARMADPGKAALIDANVPTSVFASYLVRLRAHDHRHSRYIYYFLRSDEYQSYAHAAASGSVQRNMNARVIVDTMIPLPKEDVIRQFDAKVEGIRKLVNGTMSESRALTNTRDELLPLLMSGKIRVKDAEKVAGDVL